jgi:hypothetical protein
MLRCVRGSDLMLNTMLFKELVDVAGHILASSIRAECHNLLTGFEFHSGDKGLESLAYLQLLL